MAMGIEAIYAYSQLLLYKDWIEDVKTFAKKNYEDMDFENSTEWEDMGDIIQDMIKDCNDIIDDMYNLYFQE